MRDSTRDFADKPKPPKQKDSSDYQFEYDIKLIGARELDELGFQPRSHKERAVVREWRSHRRSYSATVKLTLSDYLHFKNNVFGSTEKKKQCDEHEGEERAEYERIRYLLDKYEGERE